MKIGIIASIWIKVPPADNGFGAQEYIVSCLAEGLIRRNHQVTLFASGDSKTRGRLISQIDKQVSDLNFSDSKIKDAFEIINLSAAYKIADQFDIVHNHLLPYGLPFANLSNIPTVHTLHHAVHLDRADIFFYKKYVNQNFISISNAQEKIIPELNYIKNIYNGIDENYYLFKELPDDDYILIIGRLKKYKGFHNAIRVANETKKSLRISAFLPNQNQRDYEEINDYWQNEIKPNVRDKVSFVGSVAGISKKEIYQNAKLSIVPIEWEEPFGMTIIESMACGTPVVAFARGSVPEVVKDGETGFIVNSSPEDIRGNFVIKKTGIDGLCEAVERIYAMPEEEYRQMRRNCRAHVERNFTVERMVDEYEKVYEKILSKK